MNISDEQLSGGIWRIKLDGRMDIAGAGSIDLRLTGMTAAPRTALVLDLTQVSFLASMGIRSLMMTAKAVTRRGAKLALVCPDGDVRGVLATSGVDQLIPVFPILADAVSKVSG
jgi:anti-anti-sigma factor